MNTTDTYTASSVGRAASRIAKKRHLDPSAVRKSIEDAIAMREAIEKAIRIGNLDSRFGYLTFAGILPVTLPDGCKIAIIPDVHVPAHDRKLCWAVKQWLKDYQPEILIFVGDVADVFALSRWPKQPGIKVDMQRELDETGRFIREIIEVSGCVHAFIIMGNHEDRIMRFLTDIAPGIASIVDYNTREPIMSIPGLLGFKPGDPVTFIFDAVERGGFGGGVRINDTNYHHGYIVRPHPGASPQADSERTGTSTGTGHTHRAGITARETTGHDVIVAAEFGNLVNDEHGYLGYANLRNNWRKAVGSALVVGGRVHQYVHTARPIVQGGQIKMAFHIHGKTYIQSDR